MATSTEISLDLRVTDNWVVEDTTNQELRPDFAQKPIPPKVGWTVNTITTPEGIKSASLFPQSPILNDTPPITGDYLDYKIHNILGNDGNLTYGIGKVSAVVGSTVYTFDYITKDGGVGTPPIYQNLITLTLPVVLFSTLNYATLFQNRTLHLFDFRAVFDGALNISGDVAATDGVFSLDLTVGPLGRIQKHALTGITIDTTIHRGVTSFGNYLLFWTDDTLFWSDPIVFTEFTVGGATQAGSQKISEAKGGIVTIVPYPTGLIIYCTQNIVLVAYSGDPTNPWIFTEIPSGTGIRVQNNTALVSADEKSTAHYAFTSKGIMNVQPQGAQLLSPKLSAFVSSTNLETKAIGSSEIITSFLKSYLKPFEASPIRKRCKVNFITLLDDYLFISVGHQENSTVTEAGNIFHPQEDYKLYIVELATGRMSIIEGRVLAVGREIRIFTSAGFEDHNTTVRGFNISNKYVLAFAPHFDANGNKTEEEFITTLEMGGQNFLDADYQTQLPYLMRDSEVFIGDISINTNRFTELLGVTLIGSTLLTDKLGIEVESTRARVFAYSSVNGLGSPVEFIYFPAVDRYLGFIVGDDIEVEVRGPNFYLTDIKFEIQDGGRI